MTVTTQQIEDTFRGFTSSPRQYSMEDAINKLKEQGVFDQQLSIPCLQAIADIFGLANHEDRMLIYKEMVDGKEPHQNLHKFWTLQPNNSVKDIMFCVFLSETQ
tara:strand:+ start:1111 stop:1422 length:312 start_codon:yes stop_codon:yes gene_type:complete